MKILAIGAHADDVEIGCGGTLLKYADLDHEVKILIVTDSGYKGRHGHKRSASEARKEARVSASLIGADIDELCRTALHVIVDEQLVNDLRHHIETFQPDRVFTHFHGDAHTDHAAVGKATLLAARTCDLLMYEVNMNYTINTFRKDIHCDIGEHLEKKIEAIRCFTSEKERVEYWVTMAETRARLEGIRFGVTYAESFHCVRLAL